MSVVIIPIGEREALSDNIITEKIIAHKRPLALISIAYLSLQIR